MVQRRRISQLQPIQHQTALRRHLTPFRRIFWSHRELPTLSEGPAPFPQGRNIRAILDRFLLILVSSIQALSNPTLRASHSQLIELNLAHLAWNHLLLSLDRQIRGSQTLLHPRVTPKVRLSWSLPVRLSLEKVSRTRQSSKRGMFLLLRWTRCSWILRWQQCSDSPHYLTLYITLYCHC